MSVARLSRAPGSGSVVVEAVVVVVVGFVVVVVGFVVVVEVVEVVVVVVEVEVVVELVVVEVVVVVVVVVVDVVVGFVVVVVDVVVGLVVVVVARVVLSPRGAPSNVHVPGLVSREPARTVDEVLDTRGCGETTESDGRPGLGAVPLARRARVSTDCDDRTVGGADVILVLGLDAGRLLLYAGTLLLDAGRLLLDAGRLVDVARTTEIPSTSATTGSET